MPIFDELNAILGCRAASEPPHLLDSTDGIVSREHTGTVPFIIS